MYTIDQLKKMKVAIRCKGNEVNKIAKLLAPDEYCAKADFHKKDRVDFCYTFDKSLFGGYSGYTAFDYGWHQRLGYAHITIDFSEIDFGTNLNEFSIWN